MSGIRKSSFMGMEEFEQQVRRRRLDLSSARPVVLGKDRNLVQRSRMLRRMLGDDAEHQALDEATLRKCLEHVNNPSRWWHDLLDEVSEIVNSSSTTSFDEKSVLDDDLQEFTDLSLRVLVETNLTELLETTLKWMEDVNGGDFCYLNKDLKTNNQAMVRACKRNDIEQVRLMYEHGFAIACILAYDFQDEFKDIKEEGGADWSHRDVMVELDLFEAMTKPAYMLAVAYVKNRDPVRIAFNHLQTCSELSQTVKAFTNKLDQIVATLRHFTLKMLGLCGDKEQIEEFLDQDDDINGLSIKGNSIMPRVYQALQLDHVDFVTHDSSQQVTRKVFYGERRVVLRDEWRVFFTLDFLLQALLMPIHCLAYIFYKIKWCPCKRDKEEDVINIRGKTAASLVNVGPRGTPPPTAFYRDTNPADTNCIERMGNHLRVPYNRLVAQVASYALFLVLLLLTLVNPLDRPDSIDPNWYDVMATLWALGYILADFQIMTQLSKSVKQREGASKADLWVSRASRFLSNYFYVYRLLSHGAYLAGLILEYIGYHSERKYPFRDVINGLCSIDDASSYQGYHLVKWGICLQGIGVVMILTQLLQLCRLHPIFGSLYVSIQVCIGVVVSFVLTYVIITVAFALGLHFVLKHSNGVCDGTGNPIEVSCNNTLVIHRREVETYCLRLDPGQSISDDGPRVICPDACWDEFARNPRNESQWEGACVDADTGAKLLPRIVSSSKDTRTGSLFVELGEQVNRFSTFRETLRVLFWTLFDPGHPEVVGCVVGVSRGTALGLWGAYNVIVVIVLLNLLIALMNVATNAIVEDMLVTWKYHRTQLWMDYCNKEVVLPSPFNLIDVVVGLLILLLCQPCRACMRKKVNPNRGLRSKGLRYSELLNQLMAQYVTDHASSEELDNVEKVGRDLKKTSDKKREELLRELEELKDMVRKLTNRLQR